MGIVSLRGVKKSYQLGHTRVEALRGVDLDLDEGELTALMGPSGSGKTTLLNILGCLDVATEGSYRLGSLSISARDFDDLARIRSTEIGFIFQSFNLIPVLDVSENVELSLVCARRLDATQRRHRVAEVVDAVGLTPFAHHRPDELSGGQQQRVAIARALAPLPRMILADEPTANLDSETATVILELLVKMNRESRVTILLSPHDPRILGYARRKIFLRDGRIAEDVRDETPKRRANDVLVAPTP